MAGRFVVSNISFLDTRELRKVEGQTLVCDNGVFSWIGAASDFEPEKGDTIIDGSGKFAIPGLFDMHVHLSSQHQDLQDLATAILRRKDSYYDIISATHAQQYLKKGITTVRGCGGPKSLSSLRQLIEEGKIIGPRLKLALNTIVQPGNQEYFGPKAMITDLFAKEVTSGVDGIIHAVRMRKADGADHIKTTTTGGVVHGKTSDVNQVLWRDEELEAMVSEAERIGMYVAAHAHATAGINSAVRAGVRTIEHSTILDEETIDLMLEKGTYITPTLSAGTFINNMSSEVRSRFAPEVISKWKNVSSKMVESHKLAFEKGVPLTVGTDAPVAGEHCHTLFELELMVKHLGMSPYEAIRSGTLISAEAARLDQTLGSIQRGKTADLVILGNDPQAKITNLTNDQNIDMVIKEGHLVTKKGKLVDL